MFPIRRWIALTVMVVTTIVASDRAWGQATEPADLILRGGKIITLDPQNRVVAALAVRSSRMIVLGTDASLTPLLRDGVTQVIELDGRTVVPGFIESHCHTVGVAKGTLQQTYVELSSIAEMQDWIRKAARDLPAGRWIEVPRNEI